MESWKKRVAITFDGEHWFVRRIACIRFDIPSNEKIYYCDRPIGRGCKTLHEAVKIAEGYAAGKIRISPFRNNRKAKRRG